jgi:thioredoxin 1
MRVPLPNASSHSRPTNRKEIAALTTDCATSIIPLQRIEEIYMAGNNVVQITDANFDQEVIKSTTPVLVDFWAEWCGPCKRLGPTIEKLAADYAGRVKVGKLDTDANHATASKFAISAIPTVLLFKGGQITQKFVGLRGEKDFREALDAVI